MSRIRPKKVDPRKAEILDGMAKELTLDDVAYLVMEIMMRNSCASFSGKCDTEDYMFRMNAGIFNRTGYEEGEF